MDGVTIGIVSQSNPKLAFIENGFAKFEPNISIFDHPPFGFDGQLTQEVPGVNMLFV